MTSRVPLKDSVVTWALWAEITSKVGVAVESAALPWDCLFQHIGLVRVLPAFRSCPGVLSINYAEEMNQLDTLQGQPGSRGDLWQACCPEQKREYVKGKAVCGGFSGNLAGRLSEPLGSSVECQEYLCLSPSCSRPCWARGESRRCVLRGDWGGLFAFLLVSEKLPDFSGSHGTYPALFCFVNSFLKMESSHSPTLQLISSLTAESQHLFLTWYPPPAWLAVSVLNGHV